MPVWAIAALFIVGAGAIAIPVGILSVPRPAKGSHHKPRSASK